MSTRLLVGETPADIAREVAGHIVELASSGELKVLGVATGSSPSAVYMALSNAKSEALRAVEIFALDEYVGVPYLRAESYHAVVEAEIRVPLGLHPERVHVPDGMAADPHAAAERYEAAIAAAGGIRLQILGIGSNGHIAFNEPGSRFTTRTRVVDLTNQTRADNSRFFPAADDVPRQALTQGIGTIMDAAEIVLVANGFGKASAIARAIEGPVDPLFPASVLQGHPNVIFALDEAAASAVSSQRRTRLAHGDW